MEAASASTGVASAGGWSFLAENCILDVWACRLHLYPCRISDRSMPRARRIGWRAVHLGSSIRTSEALMHVNKHSLQIVANWDGWSMRRTVLPESLWTGICDGVDATTPEATRRASRAAAHATTDAETEFICGCNWLKNQRTWSLGTGKTETVSGGSITLAVSACGVNLGGWAGCLMRILKLQVSQPSIQLARPLQSGSVSCRATMPMELASYYNLTHSRRYGPARAPGSVST